MLNNVGIALQFDEAPSTIKVKSYAYMFLITQIANSK